MKQYRVRSNRTYGRKPIYIYGDNVEDAAERNKGTIACADYENVLKKEIVILSVEYKEGILGGKGGHVVTFEYEQGCPTNGRRIGTAWLYTDKDGNPKE